jgi:hypothetical protein
MNLPDDCLSQAESTLIVTSFKMESELHARDKAGVQDFVLLEDFTNEDAFLDNLQKRYNSDLIYVSQYRKKSISLYITWKTYIVILQSRHVNSKRTGNDFVICVKSTLCQQ